MELKNKSPEIEKRRQKHRDGRQRSCLEIGAQTLLAPYPPR